MEIAQKIKTGALWNTIGFVSRFVIGMGSSILFVRLLGQKDYGIVTFILSVEFFAGILVNLGLGTVMTKSIAENRALGQENQLYSMLKKIVSARALVIAGLVIFFMYSPALARGFGKPGLGRFLYLVPLLVVTTIYQGTLKTLLTAYYQQKFINVMSVMEMIIKLGLVLLAIQLGFGVIGFLVAIMVSQTVNAAQLLHRARKKIFARLPGASVVFDLKSKFSLAVHSFAVAISIRLLGRESDLFLLGILHHDIRQVAIYAVIFGLPNMIFEVFRNMIGGGLGLTAFTELAKSGRIEELKQNYRKVLQFFSILLFPAIIGGVIVGGELAVMMYGDEYTGLALPLAILFITLGLGAISPVTVDVMYALNLDRALMYCQAGYGILNIIVNILVIPKYGALGVAVTTGSISVLNAITQMILIHRRIHPQYPVKQWIRYLIIAGIMGLTAWKIPLAIYWKIVVGAVVYGILFLIQEVVFDRGRNLKLVLDKI